MSQSHPELEGYVPHDARPLRSKRTARLIRLGVLLVIVAFVLPGILTIVGGSARNAEQACAAEVSRLSTQTSGAEARFEVFGPGVLGWECYATTFGGPDIHIDSMGLIPVVQRPTQSPGIET